MQNGDAVVFAHSLHVFSAHSWQSGHVPRGRPQPFGVGILGSVSVLVLFHTTPEPHLSLYVAES